MLSQSGSGEEQRASNPDSPDQIKPHIQWFITIHSFLFPEKQNFSFSRFAYNAIFVSFHFVSFPIGWTPDIYSTSINSCCQSKITLLSLIPISRPVGSVWIIKHHFLPIANFKDTEQYFLLSPNPARQPIPLIRSCYQFHSKFRLHSRQQDPRRFYIPFYVLTFETVLRRRHCGTRLGEERCLISYLSSRVISFQFFFGV